MCHRFCGFGKPALWVLVAGWTLLDLGCALQHPVVRAVPDMCSVDLRIERPGLLPFELTASTGSEPFRADLFTCGGSREMRTTVAESLWLQTVTARYAAICAGAEGSDADRRNLCASGARLCRVDAARCVASVVSASGALCTGDPGTMVPPLCEPLPSAAMLRVFRTGDAAEAPVAALDFGSTPVGVAERRSLTVKNTGGGELVVKPQRATLPGMPAMESTDFFLETSGASPCAARNAAEITRGGRVLLAGEGCTVELRFQPSFGSLPGMPKRAELQIPYNDRLDRTLSPPIVLSGEAISGQVTIAPADPTPSGYPAGLKLCFNVAPTMVGADRCWERPLRISANTAQVRLRQITPPAGYTVTPAIGPGALQPLLPAGGSQWVTVRFCASPPATPTQGSLVISTNVVPQATYPILLLPPSSMCTALPLP